MLLIAIINFINLSSARATKRAKEVGIRKTLGASITSIVLLMSREFIGLVILANFAAIPAAWYFGNRWLENYAYHTTINPFIFIWTILITLALTLLTISFQTIRTARMNPVDALRYE